MFAVIKTGGKQYKVQADDTLTVEKIEGMAGDTAAFDHVLMVGDGDNVTIGAPFVEGASVAYEIVEQGKGEKIVVFKKRRRQKSEKTLGHRQLLSTVKITEILTGGKKAKVSKAKVADDAKSEKAPAKAAKTKAAADDKKADDKAAKSKASAKDSKAEEKLAKPAKKDAKAAKDSGSSDMQPLFTAPGGEPDDLKKISGVGPVLEKKLHALGITKFSQVAAFTAEDIERVDDVLNFKGRIERDEWVDQAKKLMVGE